MDRLSNLIIPLAIVVVLGLAAKELFFPRAETRIIEKPVTVWLSPAQMDSLQLAITLKVKGELKPEILVKKDTALAAQRLREILALRDSLKGLAEIALEYNTDTLGKYEDTLHVRAEFVSENISVVFKPRERSYVTTVRDTITYPVPRGLFDFDVKDGVELLLGVFLGSRLK
jgi:hypothetical protein